MERQIERAPNFFKLSKLHCIEFGRDLTHFFKVYDLNRQFLPSKSSGAGKSSALQTLFALSKIHYIEFGRDPTQNFSKIKQFLLLEVKLPNFPNFGHLFLKNVPETHFFENVSSK